MALNVGLIRASFEQAKPIADQVADKFYELLWSDYPEVKPLFDKVDMILQKKALIGALVYVVDHLEEPESLVTYLKVMGGRHLKYSVEEFHYEKIGATLIKTFAHFFGTNWTNQLNMAWTEAYGIISGLMIDGATEARNKGKVIPITQSSQGAPAPVPAIHVKLPAKFVADLRAAVKVAVEQAVVAEIARIVEEEVAGVTKLPVGEFFKRAS